MASRITRASLTAFGCARQIANPPLAEPDEPDAGDILLPDLQRRADDSRIDGHAEGGRPSGTPDSVALAVAWFPAGEYERAIDLWPSLAEDWADVPHAEYCARMDGQIKWMRAQGVTVLAVAPIVVDELVAWCDERGEDPEDARASYAADRFSQGHALDWPPGRNDPCWCGAPRKYKKCCGRARAAPMHAGKE